jgi:hypothetical protein
MESEMKIEANCLWRGLLGKGPPDPYMGRLWRFYNAGNLILLGVIILAVLSIETAIIIGIWELLT